MGYYLNSLANLPIDEGVEFYIFVVNGQYEEPLNELVQRNFASIARSIGSHAVIAQGLNPQEFSDQIAAKYLGDDYNAYFHFLPALLITNAHPEQVTDETVRLFVPLKDAEKRFGGWPQLFGLMARFVRGESDEFVQKFKQKEKWLEDGNKVFEMNPGLFGFSINLNALADIAAKRHERSKRPPYSG